MKKELFTKLKIAFDEKYGEKDYLINILKKCIIVEKDDNIYYF